MDDAAKRATTRARVKVKTMTLSEALEALAKVAKSSPFLHADYITDAAATLGHAPDKRAACAQWYENAANGVLYPSNKAPLLECARVLREYQP